MTQCVIKSVASGGARFVPVWSRNGMAIIANSFAADLRRWERGAGGGKWVVEGHTSRVVNFYFWRVVAIIRFMMNRKRSARKIVSGDRALFYPLRRRSPGNAQRGGAFHECVWCKKCRSGVSSRHLVMSRGTVRTSRRSTSFRENIVLQHERRNP